ncbi:leucine-rich repeat-containing protein 61-like [Hydractinia symbiolongicarpus]|uniref:leucine-rich repeat-containing protein 61-like n=1 Tax=Hydractinia symbiolongicarpus TaxID=13093 RepID=UPI00254B46AA|nr:leucine-rich repeat-containing protein 61-like [Hydractinia symbiolongicarpus]
MAQVITSRFLKDETQQFDLETIFVLSLNNRGIFDLGCIGECANLVYLDLSSNKLSSVMALRKLTCLESLDVSSNRLAALSGLERLESLSRLNISGNFLNSVDTVLPLTKLDKLKTLILKDDKKNLTNPLYASNCDASKQIVELLPWLEIINGEPQLGEVKELNRICSEMDVCSSKYNHSVSKQLLDWKASTFEEPSFVRLGFERNGAYEKAEEIANNCGKRSMEAHKILEEMRAFVFDT